MNASTSDLHAFAEHWGNFGLLQFVYSFIDQATLLALEIDPGLCHPCPGWYRAKMYVKVSVVQTKCPPLIEETGILSQGAALTKFLEPAEELLGTKYAAVGLVEDWNGSMHLFDALRLPNYNWTMASANMTSKNQNKYAVEEHEMVQSALTDPVVKNFLWLDILFYDHAVSVHNKQLREYSLT